MPKDRPVVYFAIGSLGKQKLIANIIEGFINKPYRFRDLFSQCAESTGPVSRIVFSYVSTGQDGRPNVGPYPRLLLWFQKAVVEPWLWSLRPEELGSFLEGLGWKNVESPETNRKYGV